MTITKAVDNEGSRKISLNEGMRMVGISVEDLICGRVPVEHWEITRDEWLKRQQAE